MNPRKVALQVNDPSLFSDEPTDETFNLEEGIPRAPGLGGQRRERDYSANPENPPDKPAPCRGLRSEK